VLILKEVKVLCFDTVLQVLIVKALADSFDGAKSRWDAGRLTGSGVLTTKEEYQTSKRLSRPSTDGKFWRRIAGPMRKYGAWGARDARLNCNQNED